MKKSKENVKNVKGMTINSLSDRFGLDRRTLRKYLKNVPPIETRGTHKFYSLDSVEQAIEAAKKGPQTAEGEIKLEILRERLRAARFRNEVEQGKWQKASDVEGQLEMVLRLQRIYLISTMPQALTYKLLNVNWNRADTNKLFWDVVEIINGFVDGYFAFMRESLYGEQVKAAEERCKQNEKNKQNNEEGIRRNREHGCGDRSGPQVLGEGGAAISV